MFSEEIEEAMSSGDERARCGRRAATSKGDAARALQEEDDEEDDEEFEG